MSEPARATDALDASDTPDVILRLRALRLSENGALSSTGAATHQRRLNARAVTEQTLERYVADLERITARTKSEACPIPVDFWDVASPAMRRAGYDEYRMARMLAQPDLAPYLALLGHAFERFAGMASGVGGTAVVTALEILKDASAYIRSGGSTRMVRARPWLHQPQQALLLWQQILTGSTRRLPLLGLEIIPHGMWGRFNVLTMAQYAGMGDRAAWGVSGLHPDYVGPDDNDNQIEHLAISAVAQRVFHIPVIALSAVEYAQWRIEHDVDEGEARADIALNAAVARDFVPYYAVDNPARACERLALALSQPASKP